MVDCLFTASSSAASTSSNGHLPFGEVHIQPTVLLSCADHHKRIQKKRISSSNRVIGALLGKFDEENKFLHISNSFAIPYDEESNNQENSALFIENDYIDTIYRMLLRVNINEKIVGWYHTGSSMQLSDNLITNAFTKYCQHPLVIVCINLSSTSDNSDEYHLEKQDQIRDSDESTMNNNSDLIQDVRDSLASSSPADKMPCRAFVALPKSLDSFSCISKASSQTSADNGSSNAANQSRKKERELNYSFQGIPCRLKPESSELVGIEQLLRYMPDSKQSILTSSTSSSSNSSVADFRESLSRSIRQTESIHNELKKLSDFLNRVSKSDMRPSQEILARIQQIWHSLPELKVSQDLHGVLSEAINDNYLTVYLNSLIKAAMGLNALVENKFENREYLQQNNRLFNQ